MTCQWLYRCNIGFNNTISSHKFYIKALDIRSLIQGFCHQLDIPDTASLLQAIARPLFLKHDKNAINLRGVLNAMLCWWKFHLGIQDCFTPEHTEQILIPNWNLELKTLIRATLENDQIKDENQIRCQMWHFTKFLKLLKSSRHCNDTWITFYLILHQTQDFYQKQI